MCLKEIIPCAQSMTKQIERRVRPSNKHKNVCFDNE
jgi:hypothetical protein